MRPSSSPPPQPDGARQPGGEAASDVPHAAGSVPVPSQVNEVRMRVSRLTHTLETDVIPRLVRQHRDDAVADEPARPTPQEVQAFVDGLINEDDEAIGRGIESLRQRGVAVSTLYVELLAPAARELGLRWEQDRVDFATATVSLGRLQRLMRQLSPDFGRESEHPGHGRRVLLTQPESEQHMFGLSMVAEFFRREGWDVLGGVAGVGLDPVAWVRRDWFDVIGFSIGSEAGIGWLRDTIALVRQTSRNPLLVVLVGGPLFLLHPEWVAEVGADATTDGRSAPSLAEALVSQRVQEQSGAARMT